jgi:heterodisulfide reductase subunit A-like polyferredoxin
MPRVRDAQGTTIGDSILEGEAMKVLIVGGGIGGVTAALALHAGIEAEVFEQAPEIREVGIGINALPRAVKQDDGRTLHGAPVGGGS